MSKPIILSRDEARKIDQRAINDFGIPGIVLMENAGRSVSDYLLSLKPQGKVVICCGKGNNAGDGFVIARHLYNHRIPTHVILFANEQELKGDAKINYNIIKKLFLPITVIDEKNTQPFVNLLDEAEWIVDAIFGTGLQGNVKPPYNHIIQIINESNKKVLAVDTPSGLDCDTGEPLGHAVKATCTVTFFGYKKGFINPKASEFIGDIFIGDIGISNKWIDSQL